MKNYLLFFAIVLVSFGTYSCQQESSGFTINGEVSGLPDSANILLVPGATHKEEKPFAKAESSEGKFTFEGTLDEPRLFMVQVEGAYGSFPLMVENGKITVKGNATFSENGGNTSAQFSDIEVKGSDVHNRYLEIMSYKDALNEQYEAYHNKHESIMAKVGQARGNKNQEALDSLFTTTEYKALEKDEKAFFDNVRASTEKAILNGKDSYWGPLTMLTSMAYFTENEQPLYESFSEEAKESHYGQILHKELFPERMLGKSVPHFQLSDQQGAPFQSADLMSGKKYTLVDFWASWCAPCRKEIPNLKKLYSEFSPKGFQIISVSIDRNKTDWEKALDEEKMPWPNLWDDNNVDKSFMVRTIPAMFLVDENGEIIADNLRGEDLHNRLEQLLN